MLKIASMEKWLTSVSGHLSEK